MELFISQLSNCKDISQILNLTLQQAIQEDLGVKSIRYYRLRRIKNQDHLVSVDAAGHTDFMTTQFRFGAVEKVRSRPNEVRKDGSFDVMNPARTLPVVFQINPELVADVIREVPGTTLPFYELKDDNASALLGPGETRDAWVDVPLRLAGQILGKLSCSLDIGRIDPPNSLPPGLAARLVKFQSLASYLTPFLESLRGLEVNGPLEEAGREIFSYGTYEELYKYCTDREKGLISLYPFDYESADILVVTRDTLKGYEYQENRADSEMLVLRASSNEQPDIQANIDIGFYRRDPNAIAGRREPKEKQSGKDGHGLTPWVWRTGKPLRLNDEKQDPDFEQQLRAYEPDPELLRWGKHIMAGEGLHSLLIVPIPAPPDDEVKDPPFPRATDGPLKGRRIVGVIRFANKKNRYIEPREVVLLQRIAERCLGPKLMALRHETFARNLRNKLDKLHLRQSDAAEGDLQLSERGMQTVLAEALKEFLPEEKAKDDETKSDEVHNDGKLVLVNLLSNDKQKIRTIYVQGQLADKSAYQGEKELSHTLTEYLIRRVKTGNTGYAFLNDLEYAEGRKNYTKEIYRQNEREAVCALASPIHFNGEVYGALVILSNRYNILPASYGQLVQVMASHIGFLMSRRAAYEFSDCINGMRHDAKISLMPMHSLLSKASKRPLTKLERLRGDAMVDFWGDTIYTHCRTGPLPVDAFTRNCHDEIDIAERIEAAVEAAWQACGGDGGDPVAHPPLIQVKVPDGLKARINPFYLVVCLFNMMKNAWDETKENGNFLSISVSSEIEDNFLVTRIVNPCRKSDSNRYDWLTDYLGRGLPPPMQANHIDIGSKGIGIHLVRRLAEWHRIAGDTPQNDRQGLLEVEDLGDAHVCFILRLPIASPNWMKYSNHVN